MWIFNTWGSGARDGNYNIKINSLKLAEKSKKSKNFRIFKKTLKKLGILKKFNIFKIQKI